MNREFDKAMEAWRLPDELSVVDAAILITGNDPSAEHEVYDHKMRRAFLEQVTTGHRGFEAAFSALRSAILANKLQARVVFSVDVERAELRAVVRGSRQISELSGQLLSHCADAVSLQWEPDWKQTTVEVKELRRWLESRNHRPPFFFPTTETQPEPRPKVRDFMDRTHLRYSAKLACAVAAWEALADLPKSKAVKDAICDWVAEHGERYAKPGDRNGFGAAGKVTGSALDQIASVVNWKPQGGAPRTGGEVSGKSGQVPNSGVGPARQDQKMQPLDDEGGEEPPFL
ncbi:hypothetical protein NGR_c01270 [Sinorhizobium fredii NGR234]|uniref:Uncharacterized protein n=1 Tax=Sinorhizobium fredii (strain NBRC 101917 / NGR234) TaxID=394 RepID=C3MF93_SINFN|nr:hypothetical protein [Sinorhizobium fredii]ACP23930.1 hypothetical protein NGR_c01270 [Sinorhizobium fredii NGR234]